jgi:glycosyltransferase involved in cell wall biosynthesis
VANSCAPLNFSAHRTAQPSVSVVIPALNEERNLPHVLSRLPASVNEVILVDGGSRDRTVAVAQEVRPSIVVVGQTRTGKGNALACGFAACSGDIIVMIDADGSTDPMEIPAFVQALIAGADLVKGSRFRPGGGSEDITRLRRLGNDGLNRVVNLLFGTRFTDLCYGYLAFWRPVVAGLGLPATELQPLDTGRMHWGDGFEVEALINIRTAAMGLQIGEVPSFEWERRYGVSNLNTFRDGWRVLQTIAREYRRVHAHQPAGKYQPAGSYQPAQASEQAALTQRIPAMPRQTPVPVLQPDAATAQRSSLADAVWPRNGRW